MKVIFFLLVLFLLIPFSYAAITNYYVTPNPPLDTLLTVYGHTDANGYCSSLIFDSNGNFVYRLTDPLITNGVFVSSYYKVSEGDKLFRGFDYNVTTFCDDGNATQSFLVEQRNTIAFPVQQELSFITLPGNMNPAFFFLGLFCIVFLIFIAFIYMKKRASQTVGFK